MFNLFISLYLNVGGFQFSKASTNLSDMAPVPCLAFTTGFYVLHHHRVLVAKSLVLWLVDQTIPLPPLDWV